MSRLLSTTILAAGGVLMLALVGATNVTPATAAAEFFDPILSDAAALCGPNGSQSRKLLVFYQKLAAAAQAQKKDAKTETRTETKTETKTEPPPAEFGASADAPLYDNLGSV